MLHTADGRSLTSPLTGTCSDLDCVLGEQRGGLTVLEHVCSRPPSTGLGRWSFHRSMSAMTARLRAILPLCPSQSQCSSACAPAAFFLPLARPGAAGGWQALPQRLAHMLCMRVKAQSPHPLGADVCFLMTQGDELYAHGRRSSRNCLQWQVSVNSAAPHSAWLVLIAAPSLLQKAS